ncbi:MAG: anion permease [Clostridia bacterium]|nr:anion permease [Clostridia bacterium]
MERISISPKKNLVTRAIVILIALFCDFGFRFLPAPWGLSQDAFGVIGVFIGSLLLWMTLSIDWPSVLCILALALIPNFGFSTAFTSSFGNETFVFLLFTFVCTYAISKTPLIKRIAVWFVSNKLARKSGWLFVTMFFASITLVGMFMSPTVLFVVMIPILEQILSLAKIEKNTGNKLAKMLYIGMAFCVSISSGMTPIAHVFPILAMNAAGLSIDYFSYMAFAVPVGIVSIIIMLIIFRLFLRPDVKVLKTIDTSALKQDLPKVNKSEILTLSIFLFMIFLWITPSICMDNIILTYVLFGLFAVIALAWSLYTLVAESKHKIINSVFGATYALGVGTFAVLAVLFKLTNIFDIFALLNSTKYAFLILFMSFVALVSLKAVFVAISEKKHVFAKVLLFLVFAAIAVLICLFNSESLKVIEFIKNCKTAMPPLVGTVLMCIIYVDGKPLVNIQDAFKNGIPWSSLLMCAGTLALGAALTSNAIGLKAFLETNLTSVLGGIPDLLLITIFVVWALVQTNLSSNMVTATLVATVANTVVLSLASTTICLPAIVAIIGMLASYAFATPPSMPHIAITASSGYADTKDVFIFGVVLMILVGAIAIFAGYPLAKIIL